MGRRQILTIAGALVFLVLGGAVFMLSVGGSDGSSSAAAGPDALPLADEDLTETWGTYVDGLINSPAPSRRLVEAIDVRAIAGRSLPAEASAAQRAGFVHGVADGASEGPGLLEQIQMAAQRGDRIHFQRVAERDGRPVARFRQILAAGGVNFYDFLVAEHPADAPAEPGGVPARGVDFFTLTAGRWQSEVVADLFTQGVLEGPGPLQRAMGQDNPITDHGDAIKTMADLVRAQRFEDALAHYDSLPTSVQRLHIIFGLRVDAAANVDDSARYLRILDEYAGHFPDDPAIRVRLLDAHFEREQWDEALEDLRVIRELFDDPYWTASEAQIALKRDQAEHALELAESMIEADPSLVEGPDTALMASLQLGDTEKAARYAALLRDEYGIRLTLLENLPGYEGLRELDVPPAD
ncbi:MAG: hypothetical protein JJ863_38775 [Deltaproteobacteria bacterium]|nr:hypothetical protein [Deltaproteobacteria bacterium]